MAKKDFKTAAERFFTMTPEVQEAQEVQEVPMTPMTSEALQDERRTQGRKGAKLQRMNISLTDKEYHYVKIMAAISGMSATKFIGNLVQKDMEINKAIAEKALAIRQEREDAK